MNISPLTWSMTMLSLLLIGGCDKGFQMENGKPAIVGWAGGRTVQYLDGADPNSFKVLEGKKDAKAIYAVDAERVYLGINSYAMKIDSADPSSFSILTADGAYAADEKRVFWFGVQVPGADPDSFEVLQEPYAKDSKRVYVGITPLEVHALKNFEVLKVHPFDRPISAETNRLVVKAPEDVYVSGWSRDGVAYYWAAKELEGVDYDSLVLLNDLYAKDKHQVYYEGKPIRGADAKTFEVVGPGSIAARDKDFIYEQGKAVKRGRKKGDAAHRLQQ